MAEKESPQLSRRELLQGGFAALALGGTTVFSSEFIVDELSNKDHEVFAYTDIEAFTHDFTSLPESHPYAENFFRRETPVQLNVDEKRPSYRSSVVSELEFEVTDETRPVELQLPSEGTNAVTANPLIVTVDGQQQYFLPFIQSFRPTLTGTMIPELAKGTHHVTIEEPAFYSRSDHSLLGPATLTQYHGTAVQDALRKIQPMYAVRPDNLEKLDNDMMMLNFQRIFYHPGTREIIIEDDYIAKSEDKGMSPNERQRRFNRTADIDVATRRKMTFDPGQKRLGQQAQDTLSFTDPRESLVAQVRNPDNSHGWATFTGKMENEHPLIQIKTPNNLMGFSLRSNLLYYPPLTIVPSHCWGEDLLKLNPEIQILGYEEEARATLFRRMNSAVNRADAMINTLKENPDGVYPTFP